MIPTSSTKSSTLENQGNGLCPTAPVISWNLAAGRHINPCLKCFYYYYGAVIFYFIDRSVDHFQRHFGQTKTLNLTLLLSFPALDHFGLLQFVVFSHWLILKCGNTSPSSLARVFRLWILLPALSFVQSAIESVV